MDEVRVEFKSKYHMCHKNDLIKTKTLSGVRFWRCNECGSEFTISGGSEGKKLKLIPIYKLQKKEGAK